MTLQAGADAEFPQPTVSIIVPTRNRATLLARTLEGIAGVIGPDDQVEVIVVDNGSRDGTAAAYHAVRERFPALTWRYFFECVPGLLAGRHRGAREARGNILCYLDDDVLLGPNWLVAVREAFANPDVVLAGGRSVLDGEAVPPEWLTSLYFEDGGAKACGYLSLIDFGMGVRNIDPCLVWGLNFAIRREKLYELGGFHPDGFPPSLLRFRGDGETGLSLKLKKAGARAVHHSEMLVAHIVPQSRLMPKAFEARAFCQGISDSYAKIRENGGLQAISTRSWKELLLDSMQAKLARICTRSWTNRHIRDLVAQAYSAGMKFHEQEVSKDPGLLAWVLRGDYFDYRLPTKTRLIHRLKRA